MDRRQMRTREAVFQAVTELLTKRPYERITVQEIIDAANIGRSTFYAHFETKEQLLEALCEELFGHIFEGVQTSCPIPGFHVHADDYRDFVTHILYHLLARREAFTRLFRSESSAIFLRYFKEHLQRQLARQWLTTAANEPGGDVPSDFLLNHFTCTFVETVYWWIRQDMKQSPEEITAYFAAVIDPISAGEKRE